MKETLKELYNRAILDRQKNPFGYERRPSSQFVISAYNPVCGDQYDIYLDLNEDIITHVTFYGHGCAISKASTSLLIEEVTSGNLSQAKTKLDFFYNCLSGKAQDTTDLYAALALSTHYPGREQCARLSWDALKDFLINHK